MSVDKQSRQPDANYGDLARAQGEEIARLLDSGDGKGALQKLQHDAQIMSVEEFSRLISTTMKNDRAHIGLDLQSKGRMPGDLTTHSLLRELEIVNNQADKQAESHRATKKEVYKPACTEFGK